MAISRTLYSVLTSPQKLWLLNQSNFTRDTCGKLSWTKPTKYIFSLRSWFFQCIGTFFYIQYLKFTFNEIQTYMWIITATAEVEPYLNILAFKKTPNFQVHFFVTVWIVSKGVFIWTWTMVLSHQHEQVSGRCP